MTSNVRDYETRIRILVKEKDELVQDISHMRQKSRTDDDMVRKYRETAESDARQIRQLDLERSEAVYARNKVEHQHQLVTAALETARQEAEYVSKALVEKDAQFTAYRASHYLELQQALAERDRQVQATQQAQRAREQVQAQYEANLDTLNTTQSQLNALERTYNASRSSFRSDSATLQKRINHLEQKSRQDVEAVQALEDAFQNAQESYADKMAEYEDQLAQAEQRLEDAHVKMNEMTKTIELLSSQAASTADSSSSLINGNHLAQLSHATHGSSSLTSLASLQSENTHLQSENTRLQALCLSVVRDLEERKPVLDAQRREYDQIKSQVEELGTRLGQESAARSSAEAELQTTKTKLDRTTVESAAAKRQNTDLSLQVRVLTREVAIRDDPSLAYESFDPFTPADGEADLDQVSDIDHVITTQLTAFKKLPMLLEMNKKLLKIARELGRKLEERTSKPSTTLSTPDDADLDSAAQAIEDLTATVSSLRGQWVESQNQLELVAKERDMYGRLLVQGRVIGLNGGATSEATATTTEATNNPDDMVRHALDTMQSEFNTHKAEFTRQLDESHRSLADTTAQLEAERRQTASALASLRHQQNTTLGLTQKIEQLQTDLTTHLSTIAMREAEVLALRSEIRQLKETETHLHRQSTHLQSLLDASNGAKQLLLANESTTAQEIQDLLKEKAELKREAGNKASVLEMQVVVERNKRQEADVVVNALREDLEIARNQLAEQRTANQALLVSFHLYVVEGDCLSTL